MISIVIPDSELRYLLLAIPTFNKVAPIIKSRIFFGEIKPYIFKINDNLICLKKIYSIKKNFTQ